MGLLRLLGHLVLFLQIGCAKEGGDEVFQPAPGTTWQWQLLGPGAKKGKVIPIDTSFEVDVYDVDLFTTSDADLEALHDDGRVVFCYFSAGTFEEGRPDSDDFPEEVMGKPLDDFPDERWLDVRETAVRDIVTNRLDLAAERDCDGVEPDNVDAFANDSGFDLTSDDQIEFNRFVATEAHARALSVGLKNDTDHLATVVDDFDWALSEECYVTDDCKGYGETFIAAGKAVFHVEYTDSFIEPIDEQTFEEEVCPVTQSLGLSSLLKNVALDPFQIVCP